MASQHGLKNMIVQLSDDASIRMYSQVYKIISQL